MSRYASRAAAQAIPQGKLRRLDIELSERCDNDCLHCCINRPAGDREARARETGSSRLKELLDEAAGLGCLDVRFTGGEPLLRDDFPEQYLHARRLGLRVMLFTNGRRIDPGLAGLFARIPPLLPIEISVYGMSRDAYETVTRARGSYSEFQAGVAELIARKIPFIVKWADLPANRHETVAFMAWARSLPAMKKDPIVVRTLQLRDRRDSPMRNQMISGLRRPPAELAALLAAPGSKERAELVRFCRRFLGPPGEDLFTCGCGEVPCIDAYGMLQPCLGLRAPDLTFNLAEGGIRDALEDFFPGSLAVKARNPDYLRRCARCFLKGLCEQCPARSWSEHGTLDTPTEYFCQVTHEVAERLGLLGRNEKGWEAEDWRSRVEKMMNVEN